MIGIRSVMTLVHMTQQLSGPTKATQQPDSAEKKEHKAKVHTANCKQLLETALIHFYPVHS